MKTYIIGEESEIIVRPEYAEKEELLLYADNTKTKLYKADPYEDCHLPVHIIVRKKDDHDSTKWINVVFGHKAQLAGLIKAFEEYLTIASDDDSIPEKPIISLPDPNCDIILYKCPVCRYEFIGYHSSRRCPRCHKMIDWGKDRPKIKKTLSWDEEDEEETI